jgi:hypothetical protein
MRNQLWVVCVLAALAGSCGEEEENEGKSQDGVVDLEVVHSRADRQAVTAPLDPNTHFTAQTPLGYFGAGTQWEPAIAADNQHHVYVLYPQYAGVPGCPTCPSPTMILVRSTDGGNTWEPARVMGTPGSGQWDAQIVVDPIDNTTVYASWLQNNHCDTVVARSTDFGVTWNIVVANHTNAPTDKDILAVRGKDVYVGYEHQQKNFVAASHDYGAHFTETIIKAQLGVSLAGGATIDPKGNVFYAWDGYTSSGGATGPVNLYVTSSTDGGATWSVNVLDRSGAPPVCTAEQNCGWAYLGAQITLTSDSAGQLYALWNGGTDNFGPERIWFATSTDAGKTWSTKQDMSAAPATAAHAFPALVAGGKGDVRAAWMTTGTTGTHWNVVYRASTDAGTTWTAPRNISSPVAGVSYVYPDGFSFPFGDYYELAIDGDGLTHAVFGEGQNYDKPGSIWYTHGQ